MSLPISLLDRVYKMISDDILNHPVIRDIKIFKAPIAGQKYYLDSTKPKISGVYVIILSSAKKSFVGFSLDVNTRITCALNQLEKGKFPNFDLQKSYWGNNGIELLVYPTVYKKFALTIRAKLKEALGDIVGVANFGRECQSPKRFTDRW